MEEGVRISELLERMSIDGNEFLLIEMGGANYKMKSSLLKGKDGTVVTIGSNGNWYLDGVDSGVKATGDGGSGVPIEPGSVVVDTALNDKSQNPIANSAVAKKFAAVDSSLKGRFCGYITSAAQVCPRSPCDGDYYLSNMFCAKLHESWADWINKGPIYLYDFAKFNQYQYRIEYMASKGGWKVKQNGFPNIRPLNLNIECYIANKDIIFIKIGRPTETEILVRRESLTNPYFTIYYSVADKKLKYEEVSSRKEAEIFGYTEFDVEKDIPLYIQRSNVDTSEISPLQWSARESPIIRNPTMQKLGVESIDDLITYSDVEGVSHKLKFGKTLYGYQDPIELSSPENVDKYYLLKVKENAPGKVLQNVTWKGTPITHSFEKNKVYIIKSIPSAGNYTIVEHTRFIGWVDGVDFDNTEMLIAEGTYIVSGAHVISYDRNLSCIRGSGKDKTTLIAVNDTGYDAPSDGERRYYGEILGFCRDLSAYDILPIEGVLKSHNIDINNCRFYVSDEAKSKAANLYIANFNDYNLDYRLRNTEFYLGHVYTGLWFTKAHNIEITGCTVYSIANSHPIRVNDFTGSCRMTGNIVINGKTGIFIGSQRTRVLKNIVCEGNHIEGCEEESLSMDCFGNNAGLCSVICKTYAREVVYNRSINQSVLTLDHLLFVKSIGNQKFQMYKGELKSDPSDFLFIVGTGSCKFRYCEVLQSERYTYTKTTEAGEESFETFKIVVGGDFSKMAPTDECGFYSGFYHCVMRNNTIKRNTRVDYGCGISLWGGGYGCVIEGNMLNGLQCGLQCNGFNSYGQWKPSFFNFALDNKIINNAFINCRQIANIGAVYNHPNYPYLVDHNTIITGNTMAGGYLNLFETDGMVFANNVVDGAVVYTKNVKHFVQLGNIMTNKAKFIDGKTIGFKNEGEFITDLEAEVV